MAYRFATKPYPFDDGVLFSIILEDRLRQVFVGPTLFSKYLFSATDRDRIAFVYDHAPMIVEAAQAKGLSLPESEMILIDHEDL